MVVFLWHGEDEAARSPLDSFGSAAVTITVPDDFPAQRHDLVARCEQDATQQAMAWFTVSEEMETLPALRLDPTTGAPGAQLTARASGFDCAGQDVVLLWHGEDEAARSRLDSFGAAAVTITVPEEFPDQRHDLVARCSRDDTQQASAWFTVTRIEPVSQSWAWVVAIALVIGLVLALVWLRLRRGPRWVRAHVRVVPGAAAGAGMRITKFRPRPSPPDVVVRIEPHADPGTHTLKELDS
ncbi:MAG TPA: hypothetical protein VFT31_13035 [Kribbella sp.]|nr:hypothetical protein [Kribbella sp.]